jgi:hypothetical protein
MSAALIIVLVVLAIIMIGALVVGRGGARPRARSVDGRAEREAALAAQADVEEHDIEEMLEARNALRKRIGRPPIGEELAEDARREDRD